MSSFNYNLVIKQALDEEVINTIEINSEEELIQYLLDELFKFFFHPIEWDVVELFKARKYDELEFKFPYNDNEGRMLLKRIFAALSSNDCKGAIKSVNSYLAITRYNYVSYELVEKNPAI